MTELHARARRIVTAWVLISVPLLALCLVYFAFRMPSLVTSTANAVVVQANALAGAVRTGAFLEAALSGIQMVVLAVPVVGLSIVLVRALSGCRRARVHHRWGRAILSFGAPSSSR